MSTTSTAPLPKLPQNPLGDAPELPDSPLGHPPTSPLRIGRHGSLSGPFGRRAPRPPHVGPTKQQQTQHQQQQPVVVQVKQTAPTAPPLAKDHTRLPGKPVSARAREAADALHNGPMPGTTHKTIRERLPTLRRPQKQSPASPQRGANEEAASDFEPLDDEAHRKARANQLNVLAGKAKMMQEFDEGTRGTLQGDRESK